MHRSGAPVADLLNDRLDVPEPTTVTNGSDANQVDDGKRTLRRSMRRRRESIAPAVASAASSAAAARFLATPECRQVIASGGLVAVYSAMRNEIDAAPIAVRLAKEGVALAYPRVAKGDRRLTFHRVSTPDELRLGSFGILEPAPEAPIAPVECIDLFVVPGLAFDAEGNRLGWGMGHYDATLNHNLEAARIGLAYESQIVDRVPNGALDLAMHMIVTDVADYRGRR